MSDKTELLPCPFCGSAAEFETIPAGALAKCPGCGVAMMNGGIGVGWYGSRELAAAAWNRRAALAQQPAPALPEGWCDTIQGAIDELAYQHHLIPRLTELLAAAPAAPVAQEPSTFWVLFDATTDEKYIKKMMPDGFLAFFDCEADAMRAKARNQGTDYKRVDYYAAPPASGQKEYGACLDLVAEITAIRAGKLYCGACASGCTQCDVVPGAVDAEHPDTVKVRREDAELLAANIEGMLCNGCTEGSCCMPDLRAGAEMLRDLLAGGEA